MKLSGNTTGCGLLLNRENYSMENNNVATTPGTTIVLYKGGKTSSNMRPGGAKWCPNKDGTVSLSTNRAVVLGYRGNDIVLVNKNSADQIYWTGGIRD